MPTRRPSLLPTYPEQMAPTKVPAERIEVCREAASAPLVLRVEQDERAETHDERIGRGAELVLAVGLEIAVLSQEVGHGLQARDVAGVCEREEELAKGESADVRGLRHRRRRVFLLLHLMSIKRGSNAP